MHFLVRELSQLVGARIDKVYQVGQRDIKISLRAGEKRELIITPTYLCLTRFEYDAPKTPSVFSMLLRKHLEGGKVCSVTQHNFDRIVEVGIEGRGRLVLEFFSRGNVILLDENGVIVTILEGQEWKDRTLKTGLHYNYPPETPNIKTVSFNDFVVAMADNKEVVRILASNLGLGATYANEVLKRVGVEPEARADKEKAERIYTTLKKILDLKIEASITDEDVVPFDLAIYEGYEKIGKPSFNEAVDEYFTKLRTEGEKTEATSDYAAEAERVRRVVEKQRGTIEEMEAKADEFKGMGDEVYARFQEIDGVLSGIKEAKKEGKNWMEFLQEKNIPVKEPAERKFEFDGVGIFIDKSIPENASLYYEKSKKAKSKLEGAKRALRKSERELALVQQRTARAVEKLPAGPVEKRRAEWYEQFRWFVSSDGFLVIGGRDADTNEVLIKKHMEPNDLVFHSTVHGAPFFIVKNPDKKDIPDSTKQQAARAAVSYSSAWNAGWGSANAYAIKPEQVSKKAPSGEYLTKGAFMIRSKKEEFKGVPLEMAVGFKVDGDVQVIGGPTDAIRAQTKYYIRVGVGDKKSGQLAREIKADILRRTNKEDGQKIKKTDLGEIQRWIPSGKGMITK
jgi:predicted ribosome quality control (RQC) complex YloA/Tae2 family protein